MSEAEPAHQMGYHSVGHEQEQPVRRIEYAILRIGEQGKPQARQLFIIGPMPIPCPFLFL